MNKILPLLFVIKKKKLTMIKKHPNQKKKKENREWKSHVLII